MISTQDNSRLTRLAMQLVAAKQDLVGMGFPEIIAKLLYERYGKLAPMIANWYKGYQAASFAERPDWWNLMYAPFVRGHSVKSIVNVYEKGVDPESFIRMCEHEDIDLNNYPHTQEQVNEFRQELIPMIREKFFEELFFTYSPLMQDINSGKLKDVAPYKKLKFIDAEVKYDAKRHFDDIEPIKVYPNGFKWIETGQRSILLAKEMNNCGSSGVMSSDKDRTILTLFGPTNKPHVMLTYSPNEKRISAEECAGSTAVKGEYHNYVLDLASHLGVRFDVTRSKSQSLRIKYLLGDKAQEIEPLQREDPTGYSPQVYFRFFVSGQGFYTNGEQVVSEADVDRITGMLNRGELELPYDMGGTYKALFVSQANRDILTKLGVKYTSLYDFVGGW